MDRRSFIVKAGAAGLGAAAATALAAPAIAQEAPKVRWRCTSSFPKSLETIYGTSVKLADAVRVATDGAFDIQVFSAGEIVPGLQAMEAVEQGSVEMAHTAAYYYWGKDPAYALGTAVPFGLNARQQNAWFYYGGGNELLNDFFATKGVFALPAGNTGAQMGGWYRKEINTPADLQGLKLRIAGIGGKILERVGVVPQQLPAGDIYAALERGTLDATEFVGPYDDEKLGFYQVAPYYYYPAFWEGGAALHAMVNLDQWKALPESYKAIFASAAQAANCDMMASYDHKNPIALRSLISKGTQLRAFAPEIMQICFEETKKTFAELSETSASFRTLYESQLAFKKDAFLWAQVAESTFDTFMMIQQRNNAL